MISANDGAVRVPNPDAALLHAEFRRLHLRAGRPSLRQITKRAGPGVISHNTVSLALRGVRVPSLAHTLALARALGGDEDRVRSLWETAVAGPGVVPEPMTDADDEPALRSALAESARRSERLESMLADALQRLRTLEHEVTSTRRRPGDAGRPWPGRFTVLEPVPRIETLPDRLFCIAHDRAGQPLCDQSALESALATAEIAELLVAGHVSTMVKRDVAAGFAVAGFAVPGVPHERLDRQGVERLDGLLDTGACWRNVLADWLADLRGGVTQEVTYRLAQAGAIRPVHGTPHQPERFRPVDEFEFGTPAAQLRSGMLAWDSEPGRRPDLRTCLLAALVALLRVRLPGPGDPRVVDRRLHAAAALLPSPLKELLAVAGDTR